MAKPNPAAAQIIPGPYIGYNRLNQPALPAQRPQLAPQPQQAPSCLEVVQHKIYGILGANNNNNNNPLLVVILQTLATNAQNQDRFANEQKLESNKYLMFPKTVFSRDNILEAKQHCTHFEKYVNTQQYYTTIAPRAKLCDDFAYALSGHAYRWFQTIHNNITDTYDSQIRFLKKFNKWGDTERDFTTAWNKLAFNSDTHTVHESAHELDLLAALIGATNAQILDKFIEAFPPKIKSQLLDIDHLERLIIKAHQFVQLFKPKLSTTGSVLYII